MKPLVVLANKARGILLLFLQQTYQWKTPGIRAKRYQIQHKKNTNKTSDTKKVSDIKKTQTKLVINKLVNLQNI